MSTGGWVFMVLGIVILIAVLVALVMWIVSQQRRPAGPGTRPAGMSAREALDHRLVSGEVTTEQYDQLRARLDGEARSGSAGSAAPPPA
ncbi:MAG TPA: hypothetical protein VF380_05240 [Solirubrobacteraceae bacterium]